ncbi:MAG: hypothetical protein ABIH23_08270 [bacterium]
MATDGKTTSEYEVTQSASSTGILVVILGAIVAIGPEVMNAVFGGNMDSKVAIICGAIIAIGGTLLKTLTSLGYVKSRTDVKVADSLKDVSK